MAINEAAYLRVGLGCVPEDVKNEMLEKKPDATAEWRLPRHEDRDQSLSFDDKRQAGLPLTAADVSPRRGLEERYGQGQVDESALAHHPAFKRFAEIVMQIEHALQADSPDALESCIQDLEVLESVIDENIEFDSIEEKKFTHAVRQKVGAAKAMASRAYKVMKRMNPAAMRKHAIQTKRWASRHGAQIKQRAATAIKGKHRVSSVAAPAANLSESYNGRMQSVSDDMDVGEMRRLAGLEPAQHNAAYSTQIMDGRRPQSVMSEDVDADLAAFRKLAGFR